MSHPTAHGAAFERAVRVPAGGLALDGDLVSPERPRGIVLFAHGSGSSRRSPRNRFVAGALQAAGMATLLLDLLTTDEESVDQWTGELRFDVPFLARRLGAAAAWLAQETATAALPLGVFGASTGGGAALVLAADAPARVRAVVSRGGRPDLAGAALANVHAPTLLIVGGNDPEVLALNRSALARLGGEKSLAVVPGATHLFEEPGTLEEVARLAAGWFVGHLGGG